MDDMGRVEGLIYQNLMLCPQAGLCGMGYVSLSAATLVLQSMVLLYQGCPIPLD